MSEVRELVEKSKNLRSFFNILRDFDRNDTAGKTCIFKECIIISFYIESYSTLNQTKGFLPILFTIGLGVKNAG